jgi:GntR family transcriptional regulator
MLNMLDSLTPIRTDSDEPPTLQAYRSLVRVLNAGAVPSGAKMPPERVVAEHLGISRVTLRRVLAALQSDGVIKATQGSGWYVTEGIFEESHDELLSFTELAISRGLTPTSTVLERTIRSSTLEEAELFRIAPGAPVVHLERLRFLDDIAVAVSINQIPFSVGSSLAEIDFSQRSLFDALRAECRLHPAAADYVLQARGATEREAELLDLTVNAPVLQGTDVVTDDDGRVITAGVTIYRGDRYRFRTTLTSRAPRNAIRTTHQEGTER